MSGCLGRESSWTARASGVRSHDEGDVNDDDKADNDNSLPYEDG